MEEKKNVKMIMIITLGLRDEPVRDGRLPRRHSLLNWTAKLPQSVVLTERALSQHLRPSLKTVLDEPHCNMKIQAE